jgi:pseudaminic acid cytidylyltransferase
MNCIAIITARGGSKRIPRKNIRLFSGKPIIAYSIEAAKQSGLFQEIMVSTDDEEIGAIAKQFGALVPFLRSAETANDYATTANVLKEVLSKYQQQGKFFDIACCIYPTAPFITANKLKQAYHLLREKKADVVFPVVKYNHPIWRSFSKDDEGRIQFNWPENTLKRSQDLTDAYHDSGQFYLFTVDAFMQTESLMTGNTFGLPVADMEVHDIDSEDDWQVAEFKFNFLHQNSTIKK